MPHKIATPIQMFVAPGPKPNGLQAVDDGLWYIDQENHHVYKLDWLTGSTIISFPTETLKSSGITLGNGDLWIASTYSCEIFRLDAKTGKTLEKYPSPGAGINAPREHLVDPSVTGAHGLEWDDENGHLYDLILSGVERPLVKMVLKETTGNQTQAANILGINRNTLRKKIQEYNL